MTALVNSLIEARVNVDVNKLMWSVGSLLMTGVAVNVLPLIAGGVAYYSASKAKNGVLKTLAVLGAVTGMILGVLATL